MRGEQAKRVARCHLQQQQALASLLAPLLPMTGPQPHMRLGELKKERGSERTNFSPFTGDFFYERNINHSLISHIKI